MPTVVTVVTAVTVVTVVWRVQVWHCHWHGLL
jgi:hypothetical protein